MPIDFFSRLRGIVIIVPECILRGSQARKSAFWTDCTFKITNTQKLDSPLLLSPTPKTLKKMIVELYSSSDPNIVQNYYITRLKP